MHSGKKLRILNLTNELLYNSIPASSKSWSSTYLLYSNYALHRTYTKFDYNLTTYFNSIAPLPLNSAEDLIKSLHIFKPIFMFYIYKVDKAIYKNSRGKSGKFTFLWKYVSPYKRLRLIMYWFTKEVKSSKGTTFKNRLNATILNYINSPKSTFIHKARKFSYNYVYSNHKNTLASNYRTLNK